MIIFIDENKNILSTCGPNDSNVAEIYVDAIPEDLDKYYYRYELGQFIKLDIKPEFQAKDFSQLQLEAINLLEKEVLNLKEEGFIFNDKHFKLDDKAASRISTVTQAITINADSILPLTWITRNSEEGVVTFNSQEEWFAFYVLALQKGFEIENFEATVKMEIEQSVNEDELKDVLTHHGLN